MLADPPHATSTRVAENQCPATLESEGGVGGVVSTTAGVDIEAVPGVEVCPLESSATTLTSYVEFAYRVCRLYLVIPPSVVATCRTGPPLRDNETR